MHNTNNKDMNQSEVIITRLITDDTIEVTFAVTTQNFGAIKQTVILDYCAGETNEMTKKRAINLMLMYLSETVSLMQAELNTNTN